MSDPTTPRLPWKRQHADPESYIAHPEGDGTAPRARIEYAMSRPRETCWLWWAIWPGRFNVTGSAGSKQDAADRATEAYWRHIASTPKWSLPVEPLVPPVVATLPSVTDDELEALAVRYHHAVAYGNAGIESDGERDQLVRKAILDERRRRGWKPKPQQWGEP